MLLDLDCSSAEITAIHLVITSESQDAVFMCCSEFCTFVKVLVHGSGANEKHQND